MWIRNITDAVNSLHSNLWALALIAGGSYMLFKGHPEGSALTAAGLAVFKSSPDPNVPSIKP